MRRSTYHQRVTALAWVGCWLFFRGGRCNYIASLHTRLSVNGEEPHPMEVTLFMEKTADLKE
jgi:hypothetical protein